MYRLDEDHLPKVFIHAKKNIKKGEQLFLDYTKDYFYNMRWGKSFLMNSLGFKGTKTALNVKQTRTDCLFVQCVTFCEIRDLVLKFEWIEI